jgi:hypothetical protein
MLPRITPKASMERLGQILDLEVCHGESLACCGHAGLRLTLCDQGNYEAFLAVRTGFVAEGNGYDVAMVSRDLALVYAKQVRV